MEIWKDIVFTDTDGVQYDFTGLYQVSNTGKVRSVDRYVDIHKKDGSIMKRLYKSKILKVTLDKDGYEIVDLYIETGKKRHFRVHRLVGFMFIPNDDFINKNQINHKDEVKTNNSVENLEWCTHEYNNSYGTKALRAWQTRRAN